MQTLSEIRKAEAEKVERARFYEEQLFQLRTNEEKVVDYTRRLGEIDEAVTTCNKLVAAVNRLGPDVIIGGALDLRFNSPVRAPGNLPFRDAVKILVESTVIDLAQKREKFANRLSDAEATVVSAKGYIAALDSAT